MLRYASSDPPLRPSPRTLRSLNETIGSLNPARPPSVAHADMAPIASSVTANLILRFRILLILFLLAVVRRIGRRTVVVSPVVGRPFVTWCGRRRGHFCLQVCPPLEAFRDFLLESEGSRLVEDAAAQLLRQVLLRDVCLWNRMGILVPFVVPQVLHQARRSVPDVHWNLRGRALASGLHGRAQAA